MIAKQRAIIANPVSCSRRCPIWTRSGDREHVAGHSRDHEDGQLEGDLGRGGGVRRDQAEDLRGGDRVAVVRVVKQEPGASGPGQHDQVAPVGQERPQPKVLARRTGSVAGDLATGEVSELAGCLRPAALDLSPVARRFRHLGAQVKHRGSGQRAQAEQDPPDCVVAGPAADQSQGDQRSHDQPQGLGAEDHADQLAAVLPVGIFAHHHRADRVVTANAEAEHEPEHDHDRGDHPVDALAPGHVGEAAEHQGPEEGRRQHRAVQYGELSRTEVPLLRDQGGGDPDDEQVVSVGEESHPRHQHRA
jgi:hypothetical protein